MFPITQKMSIHLTNHTLWSIQIIVVEHNWMYVTDLELNHWDVIFLNSCKKAHLLGFSTVKSLCKRLMVTKSIKSIRTDVSNPLWNYYGGTEKNVASKAVNDCNFYPSQFNWLRSTIVTLLSTLPQWKTSGTLQEHLAQSSRGARAS